MARARTTPKISWAAIRGETSPAAPAEDTPGSQTISGGPTAHAAGGRDTSRRHVTPGGHTPLVAGGQAAQPARAQTATPTVGPLAGRDRLPAGSHSDAGARGRIADRLADPLLAFAADILTDLERTRIANENRLRQLTRAEPDADGEVRGFGLDTSHPDVARLAALVDMLKAAEKHAEGNLTRRMREHPLQPWVDRSKGVGMKQAARLLASVGDPYMRPEITRDDVTEPARPRRVSELWAFAGYHVIQIQVPAAGHHSPGAQTEPAGGGPGTPASQQATGGQHVSAGGGQDSHPGPTEHGTQTVTAGVAPRRQRGVRANWSSTAKMRAYLVAESCIKQRTGGYRKVYDEARARYAGATHQVDCIRCGPRGNPAKAGSPLSDGHKHARGLRAVAKAILRDLWREARTVHEETATSSQIEAPSHSRAAAGGTQPAISSQIADASQVATAADGDSPASSHIRPGAHPGTAAGHPAPPAGGHSSSATQTATAAGPGDSTPPAAMGAPPPPISVAAAGGDQAAASSQSTSGSQEDGAAGGGGGVATSSHTGGGTRTPDAAGGHATADGGDE